MGRKTIASLEATIAEVRAEAEQSIINSVKTISHLERQIQTQSETIKTNKVSIDSMKAHNRKQDELLEKARGIFVTQRARIKELEADPTSTSMDIFAAFNTIGEYMNQEGYGWDSSLVQPRMNKINLLSFQQRGVLNKICYSLTDVAVNADIYHSKLFSEALAKQREGSSSHGGATYENLLERVNKAYNARIACDELLEAAMASHKTHLERDFNEEAARAGIRRRIEDRDAVKNQPLNQAENSKAEDKLSLNAMQPRNYVPESTASTDVDPRMQEAPDAPSNPVQDYLDGIRSNANRPDLNTDGINTSTQDVADMETGHVIHTQQKGDPVLAQIAADGLDTRAA